MRCPSTSLTLIGTQTSKIHSSKNSGGSGFSSPRTADVGSGHVSTGVRQVPSSTWNDHFVPFGELPEVGQNPTVRLSHSPPGYRFGPVKLPGTAAFWSGKNGTEPDTQAPNQVEHRKVDPEFLQVGCSSGSGFTWHEGLGGGRVSGPWLGGFFGRSARGVPSAMRPPLRP